MSISVTLLGTGVGIPQRGRSQAGLLIASGDPLLIDCGAGTLLRLIESGADIRGIDAVLLTHLHLDHSADALALANARHLMGLGALRIYGPAGVFEWFSAMRSAYPYLREMKADVNEVRAGDRLQLKGLDISSAPAVHSVPALAYRFQSGDKSVTYSGDTEPSGRIADLAAGSEVLIHECSFPDSYDVTNHTTPTRLAEAVKDVGRIVLTHFYPQAAGREEEMARRVSEISGTPALAGRDLMVLDV